MKDENYLWVYKHMQDERFQNYMSLQKLPSWEESERIAQQRK